MFKNNRLDTYYVKADHRKEIEMKYIYIGKIVNTHGIKGELRILSKFKYKDKVFKKNMKIYIGNNKIEEEINTYRQHKNFDMITLLGYNNINEVLKYKGENVYILESDLNLNDSEYLDETLEGFAAIINDKVVGKVVRIERYKVNQIIVVNNGVKDFLIPFVSDIILNVDLKKKQIIIKDIKGLID